MSDQPQLSAQDLLDQLRGQFEKLCSDVAAVVNAAPAGQVINASEEAVRDLLAALALPAGHLPGRLAAPPPSRAGGFPPLRHTRRPARPCRTRALKTAPSTRSTAASR